MKLPDEQKASGGEAAQAGGKPLVPINGAILGDVKVKLDARLGTGTLQVKELLALKVGAAITLDTPLNGEVEILLNDAVVARGEIVAIGDQYGVRVTSVAPAEVK